MSSAVSLTELHEQFGNDIEFLFVYIREAHPVDGLKSGNRHEIEDPLTLEERIAVALQCCDSMKTSMTILVDEMDDPVMTAYAAFPERLFLVGKDGAIAYRGGQGPLGFEPEELKEAIERELK